MANVFQVYGQDAANREAARYDFELGQPRFNEAETRKAVQFAVDARHDRQHDRVAAQTNGTLTAGVQQRRDLVGSLNYEYRQANKQLYSVAARELRQLADQGGGVADDVAAAGAAL